MCKSRPTYSHCGKPCICHDKLYFFTILKIHLFYSDGIKFYMSANKVILSSGDINGIILPKYFKNVVDRKTGTCSNTMQLAYSLKKHYATGIYSLKKIVVDDLNMVHKKMYLVLNKIFSRTSEAFA